MTTTTPVRPEQQPAGDRPAPVIVIGAGPAGQTAALLLARWGLPVVILDDRDHRDLTGSRAIVQQRDVLDIWEIVGAGAEIARRGLTWTTARTFYRQQQLFSVDFVDSGHSPFPPFVNIAQGDTEAVLDDRIAAQPLINLRWGHRVTAIEQDDDGATLTCLTPTGVKTLRCDYVIAATGAHSGDIRQLLGVSFEGQSFDDCFLICDIHADLPGWESERRFYFDPPWNPGRQVLIHPCPDSTFRIDWQVPPDFDLAADEASGGLDQRVRAIIGDRPYDIVWKSVYRFQARLADRMRVGRVLLAGDAAHLMAPFGARGLNSGVQDAENAAWKLTFVIRGWAPPALLDSYHDERHAAAAENLDVTAATMRFLVPGDDDQRHYRETTLQAAITDPTARARVDSGRLVEAFWYTDSPLTTRDPRRPFAGRPPKGHNPPPAPGILIPDAPITLLDQSEIVRLRQLVRQGITILTTSTSSLNQHDHSGRPIRTYRLSDLDPTGALQTLLDARDDETWLIRPDGHIAAVAHDADALDDALDRLMATTTRDLATAKSR